MDRYRRDDFSARTYNGPTGLSRATMANPADYGRYDYPERSGDRYHRPRMSQYRDDAVVNAPARPAPSTERNGESSERYVKLLERDIESLREELTAARERADNPELLRELRTVQDSLREETRKVHELESKLHQADETAARFDALQIDYAQLREDLRQAQLDITQMERDLHHAQDGARSAEQRESSLAVRVYSSLRHLASLAHIAWAVIGPDWKIQGRDALDARWAGGGGAKGHPCCSPAPA